MTRPHRDFVMSHIGLMSTKCDELCTEQFDEFHVTFGFDNDCKRNPLSNASPLAAT